LDSTVAPPLHLRIEVFKPDAIAYDAIANVVAAKVHPELKGPGLGNIYATELDGSGWQNEG
jgi:hypothetical protein